MLVWARVVTGTRVQDMGFEPQVRSIIAFLPKSAASASDALMPSGKHSRPYQTLFFTATWPKEVQKLARELLRPDVVHLRLAPSFAPACSMLACCAASAAIATP